mgnify:CR=1 FL=1
MNPKTQLVLIGVSGLFAILFDLVDFSIGFYCTKPLTTLLILTLPLRFPHDQLKAYKKTVLLGLLFCLIGDSFLLFESFFLYGLTSFLVGHLCFLFAFGQGGFLTTKSRCHCRYIMCAPMRYLLVTHIPPQIVCAGNK